MSRFDRIQAALKTSSVGRGVGAVYTRQGTQHDGVTAAVVALACAGVPLDDVMFALGVTEGEIDRVLSAFIENVSDELKHTDAGQ